MIESIQTFHQLIHIQTLEEPVERIQIVRDATEPRPVEDILQTAIFVIGVTNSHIGIDLNIAPVR